MTGRGEQTQADAMWPLRSFLYVPATRPEWVAKAIKAEPDAVILDLEDAVGPGEKGTAPVLVPAEIETLRQSRVRAFVRPNQMTSGGVEDLHACVCPGLAGIVLPKATVAQVERAHDVLSYCEGKAGMPHGEVCIVALPETAEGLREAYQIASASPRVKSLLGGVAVIEGDIAWSVGFRPTIEGLEQLYLQSKLILDCRAAGVKYPIAGILTPKIDDLATVEAFTRRAKQCGFTGGAVIHPSHVKIVNAVFRLTEEEVAHYEGLIAALEEGHRRGDGAVRYKGSMIDLAFLPIAREAVAESKRRRR